MVPAARAISRILLTVLLAGFLSAALVRYAPGFEVDEQQLDGRWSGERLRRLAAARQADADIVSSYGRILKGYLTGNLGYSISLERPVAELIRERAGATLVALAVGLAVSWIGGLALILPSLRFHNRLFLTLTGGILQCAPAGLIAMILLVAGGRGPLLCGVAVGLVVYPKIAQYMWNLVAQLDGMAHVRMARAKGLGEWRILVRHVLLCAAPQLLALFGVSVGLALSAVVTAETLLDVAGLGQLAWQAATARDLPVLVSLTAVISLAITTTNAVADGLGSRMGRCAS